MSTITNCLKRCPCCGGSGEFEEKPVAFSFAQSSWMRIRCTGCGLATKWIMRRNKSMNVMPILSDLWNRRVGERAA